MGEVVPMVGMVVWNQTVPDTKKQYAKVPLYIESEYLSALPDVRHEKTDKIFVDAIPKEGLTGWGPANPSLGMTPPLKYYSIAFIDYIL